MSEEIKRRIKDWEEKNGKKVKELKGEELLEAVQEIMCLTRREAEEYLSYLASM